MSFVFYFSFSFNCLFWILIDYLESVVVVMAVIKVMDEILANKIAAGEVASSCASVVKDETEDKTEMARGSYIAEKNVVTVVPLERKVFNKQLVCNGKLEAQSKVTLQFSGLEGS